MKRGEWHEKARQLHAKRPDMTHAQIAQECGVTGSAVTKVLNPDRAREYARRAEAKPGRAAAKRAWERAWRQSEAGRSLCANPACGQPCGAGTSKPSREGTLCRPCYLATADVRRTLTEGMWADGWPLKDIAAALGVTLCYFGPCRARGWDLPHRYPIDTTGRRLPDAA